MAFKLIYATEAKPGISIMLENAPCVVKSQDISKTGKHGHAKVRLEAIGIIDGKKRVTVLPGHERFEVPLIEKKRAQVLSILGDKASIMDLESFETLDIMFDEELKDKIKEGIQVEYWKIEEQRIIKRIG